MAKSGCMAMTKDGCIAIWCTGYDSTLLIAAALTLLAACCSCASNRPGRDPEERDGWPSWGFDRANTRRCPNAVIGKPSGFQDAFAGGFNYGGAVVGDEGMAFSGSGQGTISAFSVYSGLGRVWQVQLPGRDASATPLILPRGDVVVACENEKPKGPGILVVYDAATGRQKWILQTHGEVLASPALVGPDMIVVGTTQGELLAVDSSTGHTAWQVPVGGRILWPVASDAAGRVVVCSESGEVRCVDRTSGKNMWARSLEGWTTAPVLCHGHGPRVFLGTSKGTEYCLDAASGATIWRARLGGSSYCSGQAIDEDSGLGFTASRSHYLVAFRLSDGAVVWKLRLGGSASSPAISGNGVVCAASDNECVTAVGERTGQVLWVWQVPGKKDVVYGEMSAVTLWRSKLLVTSLKGRIYVIDTAPRRRAHEGPPSNAGAD
jgi:outer membrane protein assembly factor BamB